MKEKFECMVYQDREKERFMIYEIVFVRDGKTLAQFNFEADEYEMPKLDGAELAVFFEEISFDALFIKIKSSSTLSPEDKAAVRIIKNNLVKRMESYASGIAIYKYNKHANIEDDFDLMEEIEKLELQELVDLQLDRFKEVVAQKDFMRANDITEFSEDTNYLSINKVF